MPLLESLECAVCKSGGRKRGVESNSRRECACTKLIMEVQ